MVILLFIGLVLSLCTAILFPVHGIIGSVFCALCLIAVGRGKIK